MLAVNQYLCTSAEIKRRYRVLQTPVPTSHINATSPLYLSGCTQILVLLALSLTSALPLVPSSELIHSPREKVT